MRAYYPPKIPARLSRCIICTRSASLASTFHLLFNKGDKRYAEKVNECWKRRSDHPPHGSDG